MSFTVVIPARFHSTRLPGKPLLDIAGKPMLQHVAERVRQSKARAVFVATDDERIRQTCEKYGTQVVMTSPEHQSGTDRTEEVTRILGLGDDEIIVNVQGDEPLMPPSVINQVAQNMIDNPEAGICTLFETIRSLKQFRDPNVVKLVTDRFGMALYFSRSTIPFPRDEAGHPDAELQALIDQGHYKRHLGIYAYRVGILRQFVTWPVCPLETLEKLEQLRALYQGVKIHAGHSCEDIPAGVDTADDLRFVRNIIEIKS